ncbi:MAG: FkbM family methyltransferase [Bacteroidota bacterium]|nr:FkbM family methyltransferase [Bacteroidota bacterium]
MKSIIKFLLAKLGYRLVKNSYFKNLINVSNAYNFIDFGTLNKLDFHHILKSVVDKEEPICCFDIGANVGQTAKKIRGYFPNSTIYCFEPVKKTYESLYGNTKEYKNINSFNFAFGENTGEMEIFLRENSEWNSLDVAVNEMAKAKGANSEIIKIDTVDNFVKQQYISGIHFFKSDTEGYELKVLKGAKHCLENQLIDILYIEVGFNKQDLQHTYITNVIDELENYGYGLSGLFEKMYTANKILLYANALFMKRSISKLTGS